MESSPVFDRAQVAFNSPENALQPVDPVSPVAGYIGGKRRLARRIIARIEAIPHRTYVEPFVGMGGVFLRRPHRARAEVINDLSADVATLFRILQRHYQAFIDTLKWQLGGRSEFMRLMRVDPTTLTDLERSARFLYLQRLAFGGKVQGRNFGVDRRTPSGFNIIELEPMLRDVHERLAFVTIERLPYADLIARYDASETLFYLDPPYFGSERDYGAEAFSRADFTALAEQLATIRGRFLMSINDRPEVRDIFSAFALQEVETTYTIARGKAATGARELVISNGG